MNKRLIFFLSFLIIVAGLIWFLPFSGDIFIMLDEPEQPEWPLIEVIPEVPTPGEVAELVVTDIAPWVHVSLQVEAEGGASSTQPALLRAEQTPAGWEWHWRFTVPESDNYELLLFHDCDKGCETWGKKTFSNAANEFRAEANVLPTKLCTVFPNPERDGHGRM